MKKIFVTFLAASTLLAGCTKDDTDTAPALGNQLKLKAAVASTRATGTAFEQGDKVGLFLTDLSASEATYTNVSLTVNADGTLTGSTPLSYPAKSKSVSIAAYYPWEASNNSTSVPVALPEDQTSAKESEMDLMGASIAQMAPTSEVVTLEFSHMLSKVSLSVIAGNGASEADLEGVEAKLVAALQGTVDVTTGEVSNLGSAVEVSGQTVMVMPQTITGTVAKVYTVNGTFDVAAPAAGLVLEAGKANTLTIKMDMATSSAVIVSTQIEAWEDVQAGDLNVDQSLYGDGDDDGDDPDEPEEPEIPEDGKINLSAEGTSNSYIVSEAGKEYKFNATVKGNGNATTYNWTVGDDSYTKTITADELVIEPKGAKIVWTTNSKTAPVIRDVTLDENGYVCFTTPETFIDGNAMVAVYEDEDCEGDILWSWHIWTVKGYDPEASAIAVGNFSIMDRNVGATLPGIFYDDNAKLAQTVGLNYQWGRKDPFPGPSNVENADGGLGGQGFQVYSPDDTYTWGKKYGTPDDKDHPGLYQYYEGLLTMQGFEITASHKDMVDKLIAQSVKEPWRWHANGYARPPFGIMTKQWETAYLWGNPTGARDGGEKSIYDPCPQGWKVVAPNVWAQVASLTPREVKQVGGADRGVQFGNVYLQFTGVRIGAGNTFEKVPTHGHIWADSGNQGETGGIAQGGLGHFAARIEFTASATYPYSFTHTIFGQSVRCMKE